MLRNYQRNAEDTWQHYPGTQRGTMVVLAFGWLTLNRILFASKYTCRLLFLAGYLASRRQESLTY